MILIYCSLLRVQRGYRLTDGRTVEEIYSRLKVEETSEIKIDGWRLLVHRLDLALGEEMTVWPNNIGYEEFSQFTFEEIPKALDDRG